MKIGLSAIVFSALLAAAVFPTAGSASHVSGGAQSAKGHGPRLIMPMMDPDRGRKLFVAKGCVACHAINGVGGHDAPPWMPTRWRS